MRLKPKNKEELYRFLLTKGVYAVTAYRACYTAKPYTHIRWLKYLTDAEISIYLEEV
jgi:hypothetical protein